MNPIPRQKLIQLVARFGRDICDDPRRCEALLRDFCGDQHQREVFVLVAVVKDRAASELAAAPSGFPKEVLLARLSNRLHANMGFSEDLARWSIESWALALGTIIDESQPSDSQSVCPLKLQKKGKASLERLAPETHGTESPPQTPAWQQKTYRFLGREYGKRA